MDFEKENWSHFSVKKGLAATIFSEFPHLFVIFVFFIVIVIVIYYFIGEKITKFSIQEENTEGDREMNFRDIIGDLSGNTKYYLRLGWLAWRY